MTTRPRLPVAYLQAPRKHALPIARDRLRLGPDHLVSPFCLGSVRDPETVPAAYELGINFFFVSSDFHWKLYEGTRRGLELLLRSSPHAAEEITVVVATYISQPEFIGVALREVAEAVEGLDNVRIVPLAGGVYHSDFLARLTTYRSLCDRETSPHSAIGVTLHHRALVPVATSPGAFDLTMIRLNIVHRGAIHDALPKRKRGPAEGSLLFTFKSAYSGLQRAPRSASEAGRRYRFALMWAGVDGILFAPQTPAELESSLREINAGPLTDEDIVDLATMTE